MHDYTALHTWLSLAMDVQAFLPFLMINLHEKSTYKSLFDSVVELC